MIFSQFCFLESCSEGNNWKCCFTDCRNIRGERRKGRMNIAVNDNRNSQYFICSLIRRQKDVTANKWQKDVSRSEVSLFHSTPKVKSYVQHSPSYLLIPSFFKYSFNLILLAHLNIHTLLRLKHHFPFPFSLFLTIFLSPCPQPTLTQQLQHLETTADSWFSWQSRPPLCDRSEFTKCLLWAVSKGKCFFSHRWVLVKCVIHSIIGFWTDMVSDHASTLCAVFSISSHICCLLCHLFSKFR